MSLILPLTNVPGPKPTLKCPELAIWCPGPTMPHSIRSWRYGGEQSNRAGGGSGGEEEGGRGLLKAAGRVEKKNISIRVCVGSVRGPRGVREVVHIRLAPLPHYPFH